MYWIPSKRLDLKSISGSPSYPEIVCLNTEMKYPKTNSAAIKARTPKRDLIDGSRLIPQPKNISLYSITTKNTPNMRRVLIS